MTAVTISSDFGAPQAKSVTISTDSPLIWHEVMGPDAMILVFWLLSLKPTFLLSSFTVIKKVFSSFSLSAIKVVSSTYLRLLIFLLAILTQLLLHSVQHFSWCTLHIQLWRTPFPIWNQSVVPCPVLTVASWIAYMFLKRQIRWSDIPISFRIFQFVVIHRVKGFGLVNKAEIDVFLELSCFINDPTDVDNLISGSSTFSKSSLNIWKFAVHVLLKPGLENFERYFTSVWDEGNRAVAFFGIAFLWDWNENWAFPVLWPLLS